MPSYKDLNGKSWTVQISAQDIITLKKTLDIDLMKSLNDEGKTLYGITEDVEKLVNVLHLLCADQAEKAGVSATEFARGLGGDTLENATKAFIDAFIEFLPPQKRAFVKMAEEKREEWEAKALESAKMLVNNPEIEKMMEAELTQIRLEAIEKIKNIRTTTD